MPLEQIAVRRIERNEFCTFKTNFVSLQRGNRLAVKMLRVRISSDNTSDVYLVPLDRDVFMLEDSLDGIRYFGTDTIT